MPTYGYRCPACGHEYEKFQKINDTARIKCPKCGTEGERLISGGAGVVFKGSGFYETDYKRAKPEKKKETSSEKGTGGERAKDTSPSSSEKKKDVSKKGDTS